MDAPPLETDKVMAGGMVIIGAGECGARAALALRDQGYEGAVTLIGDEPHPPYERPPLSKEAMTAGHEAPKFAAGVDAFEQRAIAHRAGSRAVAIDRQAKTVRLSDGCTIAYDTLLLATGAVPRRLPTPGPGSRCLYLRTFADALAIRAHLKPDSRIAIVGGGFIGLELAASARKLGAAVTLIEAQARILMRGVPAQIAEVVQAAHVANGVDMRCGSGITAFADDGDQVAITLTNGETVTADIAVIGIGAVPVTELAEAAGLEVANGIVVNETLRTADPSIFAAGDCCAFPLALYGGRKVRLEAWRNAQEQGALAARNMLGAHEAHEAVPWFWSDQYDLTLQIAGLADGAAATVRRDLAADAFVLFHLDEGGRLLAASGIGPGNAVAKDIRLAEMLIARRARPDAASLASAEVKLKSLLAA